MIPVASLRKKLDWLKDLKNVRRGRIEEYAREFGVAFHEGKRPWGITCEIAMPCATQNELDIDDAKMLVNNGCIVIAEGANMPSTNEAVDFLIAAAVLFAPGKAANAGGVAVSGLEMSQNAARMSWTEAHLDDMLQEIMKEIHDNCVRFGGESDGSINYVKGANIAGFVKVADAMLAYGNV